MSCHKLTSYRASLVGVLRAQSKTERLEPALQGMLELADSAALRVIRQKLLHVSNMHVPGQLRHMHSLQSFICVCMQQCMRCLLVCL